MTVAYYEWGLQKNKPSGGGGEAPLSSLYGEPTETSGVLGAGISTVSFSRPTKSLHILNTDAENDLEISIDVGSGEWLQIMSLGDLKINAMVSSILLRGTAGGTFRVVAVLT